MSISRPRRLFVLPRANSRVVQPQSQTREHPRRPAITPGYSHSLETLLRRILPRG
jgi:hypothetical protein